MKKEMQELKHPYVGTEHLLLAILHNVDLNITVINGSTYPNEENNNLILAAHSGNCSYCYFDNLYKLELADKAYLQYKNKKYKDITI